jgi:hypothetical protein
MSSQTTEEPGAGASNPVHTAVPSVTQAGSYFLGELDNPQNVTAWKPAESRVGLLDGPVLSHDEGVDDLPGDSGDLHGRDNGWPSPPPFLVC